MKFSDYIRKQGDEFRKAGDGYEALGDTSKACIDYAVQRYIDEYAAKQQAIAFFTWYGIRMASFLEYITKVKPIVKSEEIEEAMRNHEGATFEQLYEQFIEQQNKP